MARITDYASLVAAIKDELDTSELDDSIDRFIQFAESDLNRKLRTWEMECRTEQDLVAVPDPDVANADFYAFPTDMIELRSVSSEALGGELLKYQPAQSQTDGNGYVEERGGIQLVPTVGDPNGDGTSPGKLSLLYYQMLPVLDGVTNTTTWLLTKYPDLYYHGTLLQAAPYLYEDNRVSLWGSAYETSIRSVNALNVERSNSDLFVGAVSGTED